MFETATSMIGLPGAVLAVWAVLIAALFFVTRGLSRTLAWGFVAAGLAIPVAALQVWPLASPASCEETVLSDGESADGRYEYRILKSQCRGSSELAYRVELGRKDFQTQHAALRPVMRSYGFPRPVAVRQVADNHFLIFLTSDGRDQVPLRISLDPESGKPSYVHRFFQGHSDRSFTVSGLSDQQPPAPSRAADSTRPRRSSCPEGTDRGDDGTVDARVTTRPSVTPEQGGRAERRHSFRLHLSLRGMLRGS